MQVGNKHVQQIHSIASQKGEANKNHNEISPHICLNGCHQNEHRYKCQPACREKRESPTPLKECKLLQQHWKYYGAFSKNYTESPYDPAIPLQSIYMGKKNWKDTRKIIFTALLFIIAKVWKQPKCPLTNEWIKMCHIYTKKCYSAIKKNEMLRSVCHMDGFGGHYAKWNMSEIKHCMIPFICDI